MDNYVNKVRRCYNCGAILQSKDQNSIGYVDKEVLENEGQNFLFCNKCFELERYKKEKDEPKLDKDFITLLKDAKKKEALIVYVVNLFSFEAAFNHEIDEIIDDMNLLVVGNKFDLLPKETNKENVRSYVEKIFKNAGFKHITKKDIVIADAFDDETINEIMLAIYEKKNKKDVYLIGPSLSGKSTLISALLRNFKNLSDGNIVTQPYPNTNLNVMQIPMNKYTAIYDTPGLSIDNSIMYKLSGKALKDIYVTKHLEKREYIMLTKQSLFIGGLAIFEIISSSSKKNFVSCYFNNTVQIKKNLYFDKNLDEKFIKLISKKMLRPTIERLSSKKDLDTYEINFPGFINLDIGILGLGWINIKGNEIKMRICVPKGVSIFVSEPKIDELNG